MTNGRTGALLYTLLVLGCGADDGGDPARAIIEMDRWAPVAADQDPFSTGDALTRCTSTPSHGTETLGDEAVYFINTRDCQTLTVSQPTLRHLEAGQTVTVRVWHDRLTARTAATATVIVRAGNTDLLSETIGIPADGGLLYVQRVLAEDVAAGSPAYFHVRNHGQNEYSIMEISVGPPP